MSRVHSKCCVFGGLYHRIRGVGGWPIWSKKYSFSDKIGEKLLFIESNYFLCRLVGYAFMHIRIARKLKENCTLSRDLESEHIGSVNMYTNRERDNMRKCYHTPNSTRSNPSKDNLTKLR